jgi:hypothetical protein
VVPAETGTAVNIAASKSSLRRILNPGTRNIGRKLLEIVRRIDIARTG